MTDPATIASLADRIEKLTGPDYALDGEIAKAQGWNYSRRDVTGHWGWTRPGMPNHYNASPPAYTASIDSAMTLVPEGWWLAGLNFNHADFRSSMDREWHAEVAGPVTWAVVDRYAGEEPQFECEGGNAATPAIALCAAALRAIAVQGQADEG